VPIEPELRALGRRCRRSPADRSSCALPITSLDAVLALARRSAESRPRDRRGWLLRIGGRTLRAATTPVLARHVHDCDERRHLAAVLGPVPPPGGRAQRQLRISHRGVHSASRSPRRRRPRGGRGEVAE
jgi:hypothetical protein